MSTFARKLLCGAAGAGAFQAACSANSLPFGAPAGFTEWLANLLPQAVAALSSAPAAPAVAPETAAQLAALTASMQALSQASARAQSAAAIRALLALALPAIGGALALKHFGWDALGWVSAQQLQEAVSGLRASVGAMLDSAKAELLRRITRVDTTLAQSTQQIRHVGAAVERLEGEVASVSSAVGAIEQRLGGVERNTERSAHGVELLCELVATSGMLGSSSEHSLARLRAFAEPAAARALPPPAPPPPPPPSRARLALPDSPTEPPPAPPSDDDLRRAAPEFLRAVLPPGARA